MIYYHNIDAIVSLFIAYVVLKIYFLDFILKLEYLWTVFEMDIENVILVWKGHVDCMAAGKTTQRGSEK